MLSLLYGAIQHAVKQLPPGLVHSCAAEAAKTETADWMAKQQRGTSPTVLRAAALRSRLAGLVSTDASLLDIAGHLFLLCDSVS